MFRYVCGSPKWLALDERSKVSLTFDAYIKPVSHISRKFYDFRLNSYRKMNISRFFQYKCIRNQIWPYHKKVKVNPDSLFEQTW